MIAELPQKVRADHLKRDAYLYVRQSTLRQVFENTESTKRQYALRERAVALGWPLERVVVIDNDLGHSGASAAGREGFQKMVAEVSMGHVGIVLGLEVSRLARSSSDWCRLLEICALTDTLILDEDGIYDTNQFNDRLVLGLKGTMSEAELHYLKSRLRGGVLSKARRGELKTPLPVGMVYSLDDRVILDPDQQVQQAVRLLFDTFKRIGSAYGTVCVFEKQGLLFPRRVRSGPHKGELVWGPMLNCQVLHVIKNPRYAGVFCYGRHSTQRTIEGRYKVALLPREQWLAFFPESHPGYISLAEYEDNQRRLLVNAKAYGSERLKSPPREGPALLQGLAICGICGKRPVPEYVCQREGIEHGRPICQRILGRDLDETIGRILVEAVTPLALEVTLSVQEELNKRAEEVDRLRRQQVERARYEAELAERRYLRVDPDNRLVAGTLEADWNQKLRALTEAQEEYERQCQNDRLKLDEQERAKILALATDFPRLWQDPNTPDRERKRMARLILEDVTLVRGREITAHIRFKGGANRTLLLPLPISAPQLRKTKPDVVEEIDRLLDDHTEDEVAAILNERGLRSGCGRPLDRLTVRYVRDTYGLKDRFTRLRAAGMLTTQEMANRLGIKPGTLKVWRLHGLLPASRYNCNGEYLYEPPGDNPPIKGKRKIIWKLTTRQGNEV
jgi:DNA invertase Pin-like site-specific DNA recombinase